LKESLVELMESSQIPKKFPDRFTLHQMSTPSAISPLLGLSGRSKIKLLISPFKLLS
jgi:hypothetical protein